MEGWRGGGLEGEERWMQSDREIRRSNYAFISHASQYHQPVMQLLSITEPWRGGWEIHQRKKEKHLFMIVSWFSGSYQGQF